MLSSHKDLLHPQTILSTLYMKTVLPFTWSLSTILYPPVDYIHQIKTSRVNHETAQALQDMVNLDGAGEWPPKATHRDSWPAVLHPYHDIFLELAPLLPVDRVCLDDGINKSRIAEYRTRLQKLLQERVDIAAVESVLSTAEDTGQSSLDAAGWNGLFTCIAYLRHAYRWATVPIVKVAQEEKFVAFPVELDIPWAILRRRYGIQSQGGNLMSNFYCNTDADRRSVYLVNSGMPEPIPSAEDRFNDTFTDAERQAVPIYFHVVQSIICFERGQKSRCNEHLKTVNAHLRAAVKVYYDQVVDSRIPYSIFVRYLQGFHGWATGEMVDGEYIEYDGVSGAYTVLFNMLDGFLGLGTFLDPKEFPKYVPARQRRFIASVKEHAFREKAKQDGDARLEAQLDSIAGQLRVFRSSHRKRTRQYLSTDAPERMVMTAGGSAPESGQETKTQDLVNFVDAGLEKKVKDTV